MSDSKKSKSDISRENGAKSQGPTSAEGRRKSSENALKLGLFSHRPVIEGERKEDFDELVSQLIEELDADGVLEIFYVREVASAMFRKRRRAQAEVASIEQERSKFYFGLSMAKWGEIGDSLWSKLDGLPEDTRKSLEQLRDQIGSAVRSVPKDDEKFGRVATCIDRELERALKGLREAQALRRSSIQAVVVGRSIAPSARRSRDDRTATVEIIEATVEAANDESPEESDGKRS